MNLVLYILIIIFGTASYIVGLKEMFQNKYSPSVFSRIVWLFLAVNSFAAVIASNSTVASLVLAGVLLTGNLSICVLSFWKGNRSVSLLEYVCSSLLLVSAGIWIFYSAPLVNLAIGLAAHFIGALPTYRQVLHNPAAESTGFWSLFFIASLLGIIASIGSSWTLIIVPIYFALFDGSMFFLSTRKSVFIQKSH
jgi:hypothetical protein